LSSAVAATIASNTTWFLLVRDVLRYTVGEGIGVEVRDGAEDNPQLVGGEANRCCGLGIPVVPTTRVHSSAHA
jgi:hypothetical protein